MNTVAELSTKKEECFGCNACFNICKTNAIEMKYDEEGFLYPSIIQDNCIQCGACRMVCPALHPFDSTNQEEPKAYAVMANDDIRAKSSSGGFFTLIAEEVLARNGYVCGCVWSEKGEAIHFISNNKNDYKKMRGSKYVQSNMLYIHQEIHELLEKDTYVLFTGTPCQADSLRTYLKKSYEKLILVDLVCHGVPSPKVWEQYLREIIDNDDSFVDAKFRDKEAGWNIVLSTKNKERKILRNGDQMSEYLQSFYQRMPQRPCCAVCKYTTSKRSSDITIGDYWGVERFDPKLLDNKGISLLLVHTKKGRELFKTLTPKMQTCIETPLEYASHVNITLKQPLKQHSNRQAFFRKFKDKNSVKDIVKYCEKNQHDVFILGLWPYGNYGSSLTVFALQEALKELNYTPCIINYYKESFEATYCESPAKKFHDQYFTFSHTVSTLSELIELNRFSSTFIVGSDCMWYPPFYHAYAHDYAHFLSFASEDKKKIAYATSFGTLNHDFTNDDFYNMKYFFNRFDHISVRETSAVPYIKNEFGVEATATLDPVFLIHKIKYEELIKLSTRTDSNFITCYELVVTEGISLLEHVKTKVNADKIVKIEPFNAQYNYSNIEDFLYLIKHSKMLLTASFHGVCFALIFNVPFINYHTSIYFDNSRLMSLLSLVGLENRHLENIEEIKNRDDLFDEIDWKSVNSKLESEIIRSKQWLLDALEQEKRTCDIDINSYILQQLLIKVQTLEESNEILLQQAHDTKTAELIKDSIGKPVLFYGAGEMLPYMQKLFQHAEILAVFVDEQYLGQCSNLNGIPLLVTSALSNFDTSYPIVICSKFYAKVMQKKLTTEHQIDKERIFIVSPHYTKTD